MLALLAVLGTIVWGGGSIDGSGATGSGGLVPTGGSEGEVGIPGSAGASGSDGEGLSPSVAAAPIVPTDLGPSGASMTPTDPGTLLQWRLPGNWQEQIATYRSSFPAVGYELYSEIGGGTTDEAGRSVAVFYEVVPIGAPYYESVGYLEFRPAPDDPEGSTILIWRTEL